MINQVSNIILCGIPFMDENFSYRSGGQQFRVDAMVLWCGECSRSFKLFPPPSLSHSICLVIISRWLLLIQPVFYFLFRKKERKTRMRSVLIEKPHPGDPQWICTYISRPFPMVSLAVREPGKVHALAMHIFTWNKISAMVKEEGIDMWG